MVKTQIHLKLQQNIESDIIPGDFLYEIAEIRDEWLNLAYEQYFFLEQGFLFDGRSDEAGLTFVCNSSGLISIGLIA